MFLKINLPSPSVDIKREIYKIVDSAALELDLKKKHDQIQNYSVNSVSRKFVEDNCIFNKMMKSEYSKYFDNSFSPSIGIITNTRPEKIACWPPHSDRVRIFALNFYLEEGGNGVHTVMYNTFDNYIPGHGTGKIYKYEELTIEKTYHLKMDQWYALNVRQAHSIENIETRRIILTISFHDFTFFDFIKKYNNLVISEETYF